MRALVLLAAVLAAARPAMTTDLERYADLLERHTAAVSDLAGVRVDYAALVDSEPWSRLVESLASTDPEALGGRDARMAFWINAYNILAIEVVRRNHPLESIRDVGSFLRPVWKREAGRVGGEPVTLDRIEHGILRPMGDPRIHGAIVCASLSCPPLRREPYRAGRLRAQLDDNVRAWLSDPRKGVRVDEAARTIHLSAIFDWFSEDFEAVGGVLAFVARHAPEDSARWIAENGDDARVRYLDYDWSLNDLER